MTIVLQCDPNEAIMSAVIVRRKTHGILTAELEGSDESHMLALRRDPAGPKQEVYGGTIRHMRFPAAHWAQLVPERQNQSLRVLVVVHL